MTETSDIEIKRAKQRIAFKQHYIENHEQILKKKKVYNKQYSEKYKHRFHCEICGTYFITKTRANDHAKSKRHLSRTKDMVIKDTTKDIYIL